MGGIGCPRAVGTLAAVDSPPPLPSFLRLSQSPPHPGPSLEPPHRLIFRKSSPGGQRLAPSAFQGTQNLGGSGRGGGEGHSGDGLGALPSPWPGKAPPLPPSTPWEAKEAREAQKAWLPAPGSESAGSCPDLTPKHAIEGGPLRCHWGAAAPGAQ